MSFATFSWPWVLAGLAGLAGVLYVLQMLRVRYRELTVVSTLLWRQAMQQAPARKLHDRFKHPWAYLLILAICSLIWLALAEPQPAHADDGSFHVLVLDGSAGMAAASRHERAVEALLDQVAALPADRRQVLWSGAQTRTLLSPGEDSLLLQQRLKGLAPQAAPANVEHLLEELAMTRRGTRNTQVLIFGAAPVSKAVLDSLPSHFTVQRAYQEQPLQDNAGITALGFAAAQSGAWDRVDVFVQAQGTQVQGTKRDVAAGNLTIDLDGAPVAATLEPASNGAGWLLRDLPARGGLLTVKLTQADALAADNAASLRLPSKPYIKVQLSASLDPVLRAVLAVDPAVHLTDDNPQLVIRRRGEVLGAKLPALEFVGAGTQPAAFVLTYPANREAEADFAAAVNALGLAQIDAMALADAAGRSIEVSMQAGPQRQMSVWQELLSEDFNFTRSSAFPLFIAYSVRWLAGIPAAYPHAAAGMPLTADAVERALQVVDARGRVIDPLGVPFVPEQAGELPLAAGAKPIAVSLLDPIATTGGTASTALAVAAGGPSHGIGADNWISVALLLALLLIGLEWYGYRKGRIP